MHSDDKFISSGVQYVLNSDDLDRTLRELVRFAAACAGSDMGSLYLTDETGTALRPCVLHNLPPEYVAGCEVVEFGKQCCGRAALHKMPWIVADMFTDPLFIDCREAAMRSGMRAGFSVPVLDSDDRVLGTLAAHFKEPHTPDRYAIERQLLFARLIAFAVARNQRKPAIAAVTAASAKPAAKDAIAD